MKVVAIDDNQANCRLLSLYISRWGYDSEIYCNSQKAYESIKDEKEPIVILLDWMMPEMSGVELLKKIREEKPESPIYVIMLTAKSRKEDMIEGLDSGADDYITKPFDSDELKSRIDSGIRILGLEKNLIDREKKLEKMNRRLKRSLNIIREDVKAGKQIQFKLLPEEKKEYRQYEFTHYLEPSLYLSGDFLNYFKIDYDNVGFYFIDVAGHGASSSFITILVNSFIMNYLDKYRFENDRTILSPTQLFDKINNMLFEEKLEKHLTIVYGVINLTQNTLTYSNAGQVPDPILTTDDEVKYMRTKNLPLGLIEGAKSEEKKIDIPKESCIYLCSDGLLEIIEEDDTHAKIDYLTSVVKNNIELKELRNKFHLSQQDDLPDDVTFLRIKRDDN